MTKALKTVGTIVGTVALVAGTVATLGIGAPALVAVAGKVATYAGPPADVAQLGFKKWEDPMTLQNGFVLGSRVNLYADTAWLQMPAATVGLFYPKALTGQRWPYAVTTTYLGNPEIDHLAARLELEDPDTPDDLLGSLRGALKDYRTKYPDSVARFLVGSWDSQRAKARMHVMATDHLGFAEPLQPVELNAYVSSGNQSPAYQAASDKGWTQARMLDVIDAQRASPFESPIHPPVYGVGGAAVELTVSRKGVRSQVVRQWDDSVGRKIGSGLVNT
ncbi:MAG: hypothetical protein KUG65_11010 [Sphingomonadaceae bacterium]|nr:hypothetical protein [Sphingomonadaceae bacterium]